VAVAGDTEVAEVDEVGFSSVRVEPIGDRGPSTPAFCLNSQTQTSSIISRL